ncbi:phosphatidylinositol-glycan biosynthesis class S protein [Mucor mucedo]|uniref:phosphatidylinositol-glycan biosynthesis class S protein n=1 Tax=Mucor mucedo TaxID=29922 RepID=UPI002220DE04|nr:phosphatidylinositol-glycan biosynthesis class S protein [Mucor mucedo]KAI7895070.1 phosphatidylinositol-glycan biosynthesis class S protein [Mucor mucedo]
MSDETKVTRWVVFAFWSVVLLGLPFWWKTTEVYRANLPFTEIDAWQTKQACDFIMPTTFIIYIPTPWSMEKQDLARDIQQQLSNALSEKYRDNFPIHVSVKEEREDDTGEESIGTYFIHIEESDKVDMHVGSQRTSTIRLKDKSTIVDTLSKMIPPVYLDEYESLGNTACHVEKMDKNDVASMRALKYSSQYETTFSLMNNNPDHMKMDWDIRDAVKTYLTPFLKEVAVVSNFTIDSQIQNYAPLSLRPKFKQRENRPSYYYFEPRDLPHFVNSAEWNLASTITSYPSINFILYVPLQEEAPLRIHDSQGNPLLTSAFLIPRWGGVVIKNPPKAATDEYRFTKKDLQPIIKIFISQLRSLIGIHDLQTKQFPTAEYDVTFEPASKTGITTLEKDNLIRSRTLENVVNTISTLKSLSQLVDEIPNMVVQDHINSKVRDSLDALTSVSEALAVENYVVALQHSIKAIELAEKAFFDPTMVSMLYFPDEHKYAIYMPLFVPISVPLIMALLKQFKALKQSKIKKE